MFCAWCLGKIVQARLPAPLYPAFVAGEGASSQPAIGSSWQEARGQPTIGRLEQEASENKDPNSRHAYSGLEVAIYHKPRVVAKR